VSIPNLPELVVLQRLGVDQRFTMSASARSGTTPLSPSNSVMRFSISFATSWPRLGDVRHDLVVDQRDHRDAVLVQLGSRVLQQRRGRALDEVVGGLVGVAGVDAEAAAADQLVLDVAVVLERYSMRFWSAPDLRVGVIEALLEQASLVHRAAELSA
jgi:hypothetical protein